MDAFNAPPLLQQTARNLPGPPPPAVARPGGNSLARYLLVLGLVLLVPTIGLGGVAAWQSSLASQREFESRLHDTARALAIALDAALDTLSVTAAALALVPALQAEDPAPLARQRGWLDALATAAGASQVIIHSVAGPSRQLFNSAVPDATVATLATGPGLESTVRAAIAAGRPVISPLFIGHRNGTPRIAVVAPVLRHGIVDRTVALLVPPERLSAILAAQVEKPGASAALADQNGIMVARSAEGERFIGRPMPPAYAAAAGKDAAILRGRNAAGEETVFGFRRLNRAAGWGVVVGERVASRATTWRAPALWLAGGALTAVLLGLLAATRLASGILRPIAALSRQANAVAAGVPDALTGADAAMPSAIAEFADLRQALIRAHVALQAGEARLRVAIDAARFSTWDYDARADTGSRRGELAERLTAVPASGFGRSVWQAQVHPEDRPGVHRGLDAVLQGQSQRFSMEFRVAAPEGGWLWIASHGAAVEHDPATGQVLRVAGVAQDVTERHVAAERQRLLTRELDHRAKNALAVVQAALRLTPKEDAASYAQAVEGRVLALARAHTLLAESHWTGAELRGLIEGELAPFLVAAPSATTPRAELAGPPLTLPPAAAQPLSMALHELATNAMKYGALSAADGQLTLCWRLLPEDGALRLRWVERGGPSLAGPPARRGFGTRVLQATIVNQLGGTVEQEWLAEGLACSITVPLRRHAAAPGLAPTGAAAD